MVDCGDIQRMETIKLLIGGFWVEIAAYDYINAVRIDGTRRSSGFCRVCLKESWDDDWHVGTSMMVGYYAEFDFSTATISFSPLASASKLDLVEDLETNSRRLGINYFMVSWLAIQ